jgi:hypothetical protein
MCKVISFGVFLLAFIVCSSLEAGEMTCFYVSTDGNNHWSGALPDPNPDKTDGPFATLKKAKTAIQSLKQKGPLPQGGVTVYLRQGTYPIAKTLELSAQDSGAAGSPIVWRACPGQKVAFSGGVAVSNFQPVADPAVLARLHDDARGKILQADLKSLGVSIPDLFTKDQRIATELFYLGQPMSIARWPNRGYVTITAVTSEEPVDIRGTIGSKAGKIIFKNKRLTCWQSEKNGWLHGFWFWDWSDSFQKIAAIEPDKNMIVLAGPQHHYGYREGQRFYALNLLCELDQPGDWCLDSEAGVIYFYPPAPLQPGQVVLSLLNTPMIALNDASHVIIRDLTFECSLAAPLTVKGGAHNKIAGCTFRNLAATAVDVNGGADNGVQSCDIYNTGAGAVTIAGGDRKTLTPAGNYAVNNHIYHFSRLKKTDGYAVGVRGVGNRVANNFIHDAPHLAIDLAGNDHVVEFNDVSHVGLETNDAGAFYMGRDWSQRGNVVRYNYFHDLGAGDMQAVYLDDFTCGTTVFGNICCRVMRGVLVGGGRDNIIENNYFIHCTQAVHIDQRGIGWAKDYFDGTEKTLFDRLAAVNGTQPPYSEKYPPLVSILNDQPALAKGNKVIRNIALDCDNWLDLCDGLTESTDYLTFADNFRFGDPAFTVSERIPYGLPDNSPARRLGILPIPIDKIGLYPDEFRPTPK